MGAISFRNVKKSYDNTTQVLHGINLEVAEGEFIVILGPSGCGKSTLLRMVAGLETVTEGEIAIDGKVVNDLEPAERDIAMVFQNYALYPHMSVFKNMAYGLKIRGLPADEIKARVDKAAAILELGDYLDRQPRQLSGGQRQRVAMGRAIVRDPGAFLFDEPLSNLDAKLRVQMRLEIHKLQADLGVTSLYVTHDQVEAMTLGHRVVVLNSGRLEQIGTPTEVYENPASTFVAGFIGTPPMTLLDGVVGRDGNSVLVNDTNITLPVNHRLDANRPVRIGIRPEQVVPDNSADAQSLPVTMVEVTGADQIVHMQAGEERFNARLPRGHEAANTSDFRFSVRPEHVAVFDQSTGLAV